MQSRKKRQFNESKFNQRIESQNWQKLIDQTRREEMPNAKIEQAFVACLEAEHSYADQAHPATTDQFYIELFRATARFSTCHRFKPAIGMARMIELGFPQGLSDWPNMSATAREKCIIVGINKDH